MKYTQKNEDRMYKENFSVFPQPTVHLLDILTLFSTYHLKDFSCLACKQYFFLFFIIILGYVCIFMMILKKVKNIFFALFFNPFQYLVGVPQIFTVFTKKKHKYR